MRNINLFLVILSLYQLGCTTGTPSDETTGFRPVIKIVTKDVYLNGEQFCKTYSDITSKEHGVWVEVPKDYKNQNMGTLKIYAFTPKPFDSTKPSVINVDGGPGQNSHGAESKLSGQVNEIHFDQRGLGCSAPKTWEEYIDPSLYSSENNVLDMERIRLAYGIKQWSIYGISYGTVPATMYGSRFPESTTSVVIEGVVGPHDQLHRAGYKIEKLNLVRNSLTAGQRYGFDIVVAEDSADSDTLIDFLMMGFYEDRGLKLIRDEVLEKLFSDYKINRQGLAQLRKYLAEMGSRYQLPQQPQAVDENIMSIIYCKNLGARDKKKSTINFSSYSGFYEQSLHENRYDEECDRVKVFRQDEVAYKIEDYKNIKPVYYLQGSHDGATLAKGALEHWKVVPENKSYFILFKKGGHNPALSRLFNHKKPRLRNYMQQLFEAMHLGQNIDRALINNISYESEYEQGVSIYTEKFQASFLEIEKEFEGLRLLIAQ